LDNHFEELKQAEILRDRMSTVDEVNNYLGVFYSKDWVRKNILHLTVDEIAEINQQMIDDSASDTDSSQPPNQ